MIKKATNVQYEYTIEGNTIQDGVPSSQNPIMPQGTGDRTGNLFDKSTAVNGKWLNVNTGLEENTSTFYWLSEYIPVKSGTTYSFNSPNSRRKWFYDSNKTPVSEIGDSPYTPSSDGYIRFTVTNEVVDEFMLNIGSQLLPYDQFGYKIPISSANTTTPVYLGEVESTRRIKKLVLTGNEIFGNYTNPQAPRYGVYLQIDDMRTNMRASGYSTHFQPIASPSQAIVNGVAFGASNNYIYFTFSLDTATALNLTDLDSIKEWFQQQYAAGTPVTVWYVLAEPTTGIVNEPLMKIGNYVDTINNNQSGIPISTNNLTVNTTIPPSKIDITSTATWIPIPYNKYNTETISTIAPIDFLSNGQDITIGLNGNTEQLEIPSPNSPIMPQGTGERTANLWDEEYPNISGTIRYVPLYVGEGSFTLSTTTPYDSSVANLFMLSGNVSTGASTSGNGVWLNHNVTAQSDGGYITVAYRRYTNTTSPADCKTMLNTGSTALPYEPYGYKIPISSANTTTPVYLGEVQTTRQVKKYEFTGEENISAIGDYYNTNVSVLSVAWSTTTSTTGGFQINNSGNRIWAIKSYFSSYATATDFKTYLAQQYANGTPVVVWYKLGTPTTGIVNEPLMKIGEYVDTVSGITVPTSKGSNTLSVNTLVQPSNVQLSISGWVPHNNIKEYKNNAWMATSWEGFRDIVRAGNGPTRYPIGTKLYETWDDNTSNAWIIVDYDNNNYNDPDISALGYTHNVVLYEEKINYLKVFDDAEAWLYTEIVLPAGTYRFTIPNYDAAYGGNKTYIFTSTVDVPIHGQLTLSWPNQQNPVSVSAYITNTSTTALFTATVSEWDGTTTSEDLGTIKLAMTDSDSTYGKLNHIHRVRYGSNNYYQSGIRQWLNADATANSWWKPTNIFDRPYSNLNTDGGLYLINKDFRKVIAAPNITCITNNTFEMGTSGGIAFKLQTQYTIRDKIFLPTHTELNLSNNPNIGKVFSRYTKAGNTGRIKYRKDNGNAYYYWFRTPYPSNGRTVRTVTSDGALLSSGAYSTLGAVRACIIQ